MNNKIEKLHEEAINNTEIYTEADNYLIAEKSAEITKEITFKFLDWLEKEHNLIINLYSGEFKYFINGHLKTRNQVFKEFLKSYNEK